MIIYHISLKLVINLLACGYSNQGSSNTFVKTNNAKIISK